MAVSAIGADHGSDLADLQRALTKDEATLINDAKAKASQQVLTMDEAAVTMDQAAISLEASKQLMQAQPTNATSAVYL